MKSSAFLKNDNKSSALSASVFKKDEGTLQTSAYESNYALNGAGYNFGNMKVYNGDASLKIHPKLEINQPGDKDEQEADAMADRVMRMTDPLSNSNISYIHDTSIIHRKCEHCEEEEKDKLQRKETNNDSVSVAPPIVHDVLNSSSGKSMDGSTRSFMESRFNHDFGNVKIHDNSLAAESASAINALAFTSGDNIVFNSGQYNPNSSLGKKLLAHELAHVLQQGNYQTNTKPNSKRITNVRDGAIPEQKTSMTVNNLSNRQIAREIKSGLVESKVTPVIEGRLIEELLRARKSAIPSRSIPQEANRTFAVAAIISPQGEVTYVSAHFDEGMTLHAEPQLLDKISSMVKSEDTVAIAIDQVPCPPSKANCQGVVKGFRENPENGSLRVYTVRALRKDAPSTTTPKNATPDALTSPKTALKRPIEQRFLFEEKDFRRIRLPIFKESAAGGIEGMPPATSSKSDAILGSKGSSVTPAEAEVTPENRSTSPGASPRNIDVETNEPSTPKQGATSRRGNMGGDGAPVSAKTAVTGTLLNLGAGIALNILQEKFKEMVLEDLAKLPKPKIDKRNAGDFLKDPNAPKGIALIDLFNKNLSPFQSELNINHQLIVQSALLEIITIALMSAKTSGDLEKKFELLNATAAQLRIYEDDLLTIRRNLDALLELETKANETKNAADQLREDAKGGLKAFILLHIGFSPENWSNLDSNCAWISVSIDRLFKDAHSLRDDIERILAEEMILSDQLKKIWWEEFRIQFQMHLHEKREQEKPTKQKQIEQNQAPTENNSNSHQHESNSDKHGNSGEHGSNSNLLALNSEQLAELHILQAKESEIQFQLNENNAKANKTSDEKELNRLWEEREELLNSLKGVRDRMKRYGPLNALH